MSNLSPSHDSGHRRKRWTWLLVGVALMVLGYSTREPALTWLGRSLDVGVDPTKTDHVMLLNGDYETRPFAVADLYLQGKADRVLVTSVKGKPHLAGTQTNHEIACSILERCGVPSSKIDVVDSQCQSTFDEATTLAAFMQARPDSTFSVVTNTYHTRRSRWVFQRVLGNEMARVQLVSAPTDAYNESNWWKHEDGFTLYFSEFLKSAFYFIRYGNGLAWITALFAGLGLGWWVHHRQSIHRLSAPHLQSAVTTP